MEKDDSRTRNIYILSFDFANRIVRLYKLLNSRKEFVISKQLLRSGTSIGANIKEAKYAESSADFVHKLTISLKEAAETEFWLDLLFKNEYITKKEYESIKNDLIEIIKILTSIIKTKKKNIYKSKM